MWKTLGKVTYESLDVAVRHLVGTHERKLPGLRRKFDKHFVEEASAMAATIVNVIPLVLNLVPLDEGQTRAALVDAFIAGDQTVVFDIQTALQDKHPEWDFKKLVALRPLLEKTESPHLALHTEAAQVTIQKERLDDQEFELWVSKVKMDCSMYQVYRSKFESRESALYHVKQTYHRHRHARARAAAESVLSCETAEMGASHRMHLIARGDLNSNWDRIHKFCKAVRSHLALDCDSAVVPRGMPE